MKPSQTAGSLSEAAQYTEQASFAPAGQATDSSAEPETGEEEEVHEQDELMVDYF